MSNLKTLKDIIYGRESSHRKVIKQEAIKWLKEAAKTGFPNYPLFNSDPNLNNLKDNQEFKELLIELKEKWEHYKTL